MAKDKPMRDRVYKKIELVGVSSKSFEEAIEHAVAKAGETLSGLSWFEVKEFRGAIRDGKVSEYQATVMVSFEVK